MNTNPRRFEATFIDLESAYEALLDRGFDNLSPRESMFANRILELCQDIASDYGERRLSE